MRLLRSTALLAFCLVGLSVPESAKAQQEAPPLAPPSFRMQVEGTLTSFLSDSTQWPDGASASPSSPGGLTDGYGLGAALGLDWSPLPYFGLGLRGRWLRHFAPDTAIFGRRLEVVEVLSTPHMNLPWKWRFPHGGARPYVAAPVGVAWSFQSRQWTRAVNEDWNSRPGLSVGAAVGLEMYWSCRWGWLMELGYQARFLSADVISTPVDQPQSQASERVTNTQHQILLSVGLLLGLHR